MGIRTPDLLIANETLYQLSYTPNLVSASYMEIFPRKRCLSIPARAAEDKQRHQAEQLPTSRSTPNIPCLKRHEINGNYYAVKKIQDQTPFSPLGSGHAIMDRKPAERNCASGQGFGSKAKTSFEPVSALPDSRPTHLPQIPCQFFLCPTEAAPQTEQRGSEGLRNPEILDVSILLLDHGSRPAVAKKGLLPRASQAKRLLGNIIQGAATENRACSEALW